MVQQGRKDTGGKHEYTQPRRLHQILGPMILPCCAHTTFSSYARIRQPASTDPGFRGGSALCSLCYWCDELHRMLVRVTNEDAFGKTELTGCQGDNAWRHQGKRTGAYLAYRGLQITCDKCGFPVHQVVGTGVGRERAPVVWRQIFQELNGRAGGGP